MTGGSPLDARLAAMTADVRSYDAVVVVGAGLSAFAYPMTGQLPALVWQAIADVDGAAEELARRLQMEGSPKELLGTDPRNVAPGWQLVRELAEVRAAFQRGFVALDAEREPSAGHIALARLIRAGRVRMVVSYNWDSCLERAHRQEFGTPLPDGVLFKPHGDVLAPEEPWILPDEDGLVPDAVLERVVELGRHPRTLLVLGYSGSDAHVSQTLLQPLQVRWPVYQVGPSATGADGVPTRTVSRSAGIAGVLDPGCAATTALLSAGRCHPKRVRASSPSWGSLPVTGSADERALASRRLEGLRKRPFLNDRDRVPTAATACNNYPPR